MKSYIEKFKGIHPGIILDRELKKRALSQRPFALSIGEHPQTLNAITKGKRNLNTSIALKIERKLGLDEGTLAILQTYFDINEEKKKLPQNTPNLSIIRSSLFWDTDINKIDWIKQSKAVIQRVFERGNELEINEIKHFYGTATINEAMKKIVVEPYTVYSKTEKKNAVL
ncbi:helix-turn-helix domain-containing protein [Sandaracinomonas limnophila]|uniref:Helix-turn-helix domain-containing protein n=2 Tax=Sandaracinomonas limnophila TaxID=1862386 RepID=A0A437PXJ7_9BACT|nr:helix-turn-helix domain-containing protein [Sandaracinomonas limnophila]